MERTEYPRVEFFVGLKQDLAAHLDRAVEIQVRRGCTDEPGP